MSYRPITDTWILARPKVKYYGAYPNGFLERARVFLPVTRTEPVLHVCAGKVKLYPTWSKLCPHDLTVDIDPAVEPDLVADVRGGIPGPGAFALPATKFMLGEFTEDLRWRGILIDRPYTEADADHYATGRGTLPPIRKLLADALAVCCVGGRVGVLDYVFPRPPREGVKLIAKVGVTVGYDNRDRCFSVFERLETIP
jgi:hypothetical protein